MPELFPKRQPETVGLFSEALSRQKEMPLSDAEREQLLSWDSSLAQELEKLHKLPTVVGQFYADYFLTPQGKSDYEKITRSTLSASDSQDVLDEIFKQRTSGILQNPDAAKDLAERSQKFFQESLEKYLLQNSFPGTPLPFDDIPSLSPRLGILLNPEMIDQKLTGLRQFKKKIREQQQTLLEKNSLSSEEEAKKDILRLYQRRVNELLARLVLEIGSTLPETDATAPLSEPESRIAHSRVYSARKSSRALSKYDRFVFGATQKFSSEKDRESLSKDLLDFADNVEQDSLASALHRNKLLKEKSIDPEKFDQQNISPEQARSFAELVLTAYSIKSSTNPATYRKDRVGTAEDGGWQAVLVEKGMGVDAKQHVVKIPKKPLTISDLITTLLAHETEGHVLQHHNKEQCPLQLIARCGGDRAELYAEMGAMYNQDFVSNEAFGLRRLPLPHYARAMAKRLEGGDYLACVQAYFESALRIPTQKLERGIITPERFEQEKKVGLSLAIDRALRLFRGEASFVGGSPTNSKELLYLEQLQVMQHLINHDMEHYSGIAGVTVETATILKKWGLLDESKIQKPKYASLTIWEQLKPAYAPGTPSE